jgi:mRNA interferase MazF
MVIRRGEIWWASLPAPSGSEPGYRRPVLILQSDDFNRSCIATVIGVVLTSNINLAKAPGNVILTKNRPDYQKNQLLIFLKLSLSIRIISQKKLGL